MSGRMVMFSDGGLTFMYRVGGIAVHGERLLVERNVRQGFCFVPGGRVEYGESAVEALAREAREEFGEDVQIGRLVIAADNLFELDGIRYQEIGLYFLMEFASGSGILAHEGVFEAQEPGLRYQWLPLDELEDANLQPAFLIERVRAIPRATEYITHTDQ